jgi:glycosyltransferase involved in cell wall biosynthesis
MSRLALLVPARNAASVIGRLLDSAEGQTTPFDEVVVYDDASDDATAALAETRHARVLRAATNTGPSHGKNVLALASTCDWLHFHDADDALHPAFVARAHEWIRRDDADVVLFATEDRDDATGEHLSLRTWNDGALRLDAVRYGIVHTLTNCGIYRRSAFLEAGGFDTSDAARYNEDQAMHLRLALKGLRFRADPLPGVVIYQRQGSMSSGHRVECARAHVDVLERTIGSTGTRYAAEIGGRLWRLAGVCGGYSDWTYVRKCVALAAQIGYRDPAEEHAAIRLMARVSPFAAVAVREGLIRAFKPRLRSGMPSVARPSRTAFASSTPHPPQ